MTILREQVRQAKHELSEYESARIPVVAGEFQAVVTVTASEFDRLVSADIDAAVGLTRRTLVAAGVSPDQLHALYLTGGSSHLRLVHRRVTELLGRPPATLSDPKSVVSLGALTVPRVGGRVASSPKPVVSQPGVGVASSRPTGVVPPVASRPAQSVPIRPTRAPGPAISVQPTPTPAPQLTPTLAPQLTPIPARRGRRGLLLAAAAAALTAVAVVIIFVWIKPGSNPTTLATGGTTGPTSAVTGPTESGPLTSGPVTSGPVTSGPVSSGPVQFITCWNGDKVTDTTACPMITGQAGLQWIFSTTANVDPPTCVADPQAAAETAMFQCSYADLPNTVIYLSQWQSAAAAETAITGNIGFSGIQRSADGSADGKRLDGIQWGPKEIANGVMVFAFAYNSLPYSLEIYVNQDRGENDELTEALDRQVIGFADVVKNRANPS